MPSKFALQNTQFFGGGYCREAEPPCKTSPDNKNWKTMCNSETLLDQKIKVQIQCGVWTTPYKTFFMLQVSKKSFQGGKFLKNNFHVTAESSFHFHWIATFKNIDKRDNQTFAVKAKPKWQLKVLFIFIELWLSKRSLKGAMWIMWISL